MKNNNSYGFLGATYSISKRSFYFRLFGVIAFFISVLGVIGYFAINFIDFHREASFFL